MKQKSNTLFPLIIIGVLFFIFGFVTWVNGTLISFFKKAFGLDNASSYLVTFAFFISYTVMAIPSSAVLEKVGFKKGMSLGLLIMSVGCLLFIPAANMVSYNMFLVALFTIGIGLTLLQTASNPYVTVLGPIESAASRISFMGVANKVAGIISQKVFGAMLLGGSAVVATQVDASAELDKVVGPYVILAVVLVVLAIGIYFIKGLPEIEAEESENESVSGSVGSIFSHANLILGCLALFCCVGLEVIAGDTIINYGMANGFVEAKAKDFGTYTLWFMLGGYAMGILLIPKIIAQQKFLMIACIIGILASLGVVFTTGFTSVLLLALTGFSNATMWPAIWPLALDGVGKHIKTASAWLIMMIAGGALLPLVYGWLADISSTKSAYLLMIPLYGIILYFATLGFKKKQW
jgi:MFS transporter, FHS family, L-fucose permease